MANRLLVEGRDGEKTPNKRKACAKRSNCITGRNILIVDSIDTSFEYNWPVQLKSKCNDHENEQPANNNRWVKPEEYSEKERKKPSDTPKHMKYLKIQKRN